MKEAELRPYIGSMDQLARIRTSVLDDGRGRGIRMAEVDNGSGLRFTVLLDRGMDIGDASFNGVPFAYQTPVGLVHPSQFEPEGFGWLRSFSGGLMTGCGLRNVGTPEAREQMRVDGPLGLHGRLSSLAAENTQVTREWKDGRYELSVSGIVREVSFFGENLELRRTISTAMGDNNISIRDKVTNCGARSSPLMVLYHFNAGFPLLDEHSVLEGSVTNTHPRTDEAASGIGEWNHCQRPTAGYVEQCFFHDVETDDDGLARMTLHNPESGFALEVAYRKAELPYFTQWKMMGHQEYVMGLEPANCHPEGQSTESQRGSLKIIAPGESMDFLVIVSLLNSAERRCA